METIPLLKMLNTEIVKFYNATLGTNKKWSQYRVWSWTHIHWHQLFVISIIGGPSRGPVSYVKWSSYVTVLLHWNIVNAINWYLQLDL